MRMLAANAAGSGEPIIDVVRDANPAVAAVARISPADACSLATSLSLRYAIQCWEAPNEGKAIFWKPAIALQGLYRAEIGRPAALPDGTSTRNGLLRVSLVWDGRPLHVFCAFFTAGATEIDAVQTVRELDIVPGARVLAIDAPSADVAAWPRMRDAAQAARWTTVTYPAGTDVSDTVRAAFGLAPAAGERHASLATARMGILCSPDFVVLRAARSVLPDGYAGSAVTVDMALNAEAETPADAQRHGVA